MKTSKYIAFTFLLLTKVAFSHNKPPFLEGSIRKVLNGKVYLQADFSNKKYYQNSPIIDSANIKNGSFFLSLKKYSKCPLMYRFYIKSKEISQLTGSLFVERKNIKVIIDSINEYISPIIIKSQHQNEIKNIYEPLFQNLIAKNKILSDKIDSLYNQYDTLTTDQEEDINYEQQKIYIEGDSMLLKYVKLNPSSVVGLWKLLERINNFGFRNIYFKIFNLLNDEVKLSPAGLILAREMRIAENSMVGKSFPKTLLKDSSDNTVSIHAGELKSKFTLVDFWFSSCAPCIREFSIYKSFFPYFQKNGLDIIGVSTDSEKDYDLWKQKLKKLELPWPQLWDKNGINAKHFLITLYPTNYLLNRSGVIIAKNISVLELKELLKER